MALAKPYLDVPGTTIFDADQSRKGYHLNQLERNVWFDVFGIKWAIFKMLGSNHVGDELDLIPNLSSNSKIWQSIGSNTLLQRVFMH